MTAGGSGTWDVCSPGDGLYGELVEGRGEAFSDWLAAWDALGRDEREPFTHPAWLTAWLAHRGPVVGGDRRLLIHRVDGRVVSGLPVEAKRLQACPGRCRLIWDDDSTVEGASWAIAARQRDAALATLWRTPLPGLGRPAALRLGKVDAGSALATARVSRRWPRGRRSVIDVRDGWEGVAGRLGKNFRGNLRKAHNKLQRDGGARLDVCENRESLRDGFERLMSLEERSWKGAARSTLRGSPPMRAFLEQAIDRLAPRREVVVHVLTGLAGDLAAQLCLVLDGTMHVLKIGYDQAHASRSPGNLLLQRTLQEDLPRRDVAALSLVTDQPWHERWCPAAAPTQQVEWVAPDLAGRWASWRHAPVRQAVRRWIDARR